MDKTNSVDWTISEAPPPDDRPSPASEPPQAPPARRPARGVWVLLSTFVVLLILAVAAFPRWEAWRARQAVEQLIDQQEQARLAQDWPTLRRSYSNADSTWADSEIELYRARFLRSPFGVAAAWLDEQAGRLGDFQMLAPQLAHADVVRTYILADGVRATFARPQFYQYQGNVWKQVPQPALDRGQQQAVHGARVDVAYYAADAGLAVSLAHDLEALLARACADWNCTPEVRVAVRFDHALTVEARGSPRAAHPVLGSLTFGLLVSDYSPLPLLVVSLPTRQDGEYPVDAAALEAVRRDVSAQALVIVAHRLSATSASGDVFRPFLYALVVRELTRLGVEAPQLSGLRVANPLFAPADLLIHSTKHGYLQTELLPEALVVLNSMLAGRSLADERQLLVTLGSADDAPSWLAAALDLTPAQALTRIAAALHPSFPEVSVLDFVPDVALSCPAGPILATLSGQNAPLLVGDFPDSEVGAWSPGGDWLAVEVSGRWGAASLAGGAPGQPSGLWLPPQDPFGAAPVWATDTVLAFPAGEIYPESQPASLGPQLTLFDAAHPDDTLGSIYAYTGYGYAIYVPSPSHSRAALTGNESLGTQVTIIPALGGTPTVSGNRSGTKVAWSPDSQYLAFTESDGGYFWLFLLDASRGAEQRLLTTGDPGVPLVAKGNTILNASPAWSPTGDWLAITVDASHNEQHQGWVGLIRPDGSSFHLLPPPAADDIPQKASFSADGRFLAVDMQHTDGPQDLAIYSVADGSLVRVVRGSRLASWSPTGHILALTGIEGISLLREPGDLSGAPKPFGPTGCGNLVWRAR